MRVLSSQFETMNAKIINIIAEQQYVCTTADVWSSAALSFFGMTLHYLTFDFVRISILIAFRQMKYKQTNKEIAEIIRNIFREYKILSKKVTHVVTDGGSAFCKAFKVYGVGADPLVDSNIENNLGNMDEDYDVDDLPFIQYEDGEQFYSNILDLDAEDENMAFEELEDEELFENPNEFDDEFFESERDPETIETQPQISDDDNVTEPDDELPRQKRCQSHLYNLVGPDFERELTGRAKTCLDSTLNRLQALWVFPRRSSRAKTYGNEILGCSLPIPCQTRWNSKYDAMAKILDLGQAKVDEYIKALKINMKSAAHLNELEKEDWIMINVYVKVMKPVAISLDRLQGEKDCSQGFILLTLFAMKHHLSGLEGGNLLKTCRDAMIKVVDKRFGQFFNINDSTKELVLASITIPKFKTNFIECKVDANMLAKNLLISECVALQPRSSQIEYISSENTENIDDFYISFASSRSNRRSSLEYSIEEEVTRYLADFRGDYKMLRDFPHVQRVFFRHNTTLASSAAVERVFSQSKIIFTPRRNRLLPENFEKILLLKHNRKLLNL